MKSKCKRVLIALLAVVAVVVPMTANVSAAVTPYDNYLYDTDGDTWFAPPAATPDTTIEGEDMGTLSLNGAEDLYVDEAHNTLYVVDTGNNRILKLDSNYNLIQEYKQFYNPDYVASAATEEDTSSEEEVAAAAEEETETEDEDTTEDAEEEDEDEDEDSSTSTSTEIVVETEESTTVIDEGMDSFSSPYGIYVYDDESLLICDTGNKRLVKLDKDSNLIAIYDAPVSDLLPSDFTYQPIKVGVDSAGRIFVCSRSFNRGLLELDENGEFVQMLGAPDPVYTAWEAIVYTFSTEAQKERSESFVPSEYNNLLVDDEGFIYVTTNSNEEEPVRRINAKGTDVLRRPSTTSAGPVADLVSSSTSTGTISGSSLVNDVCVLDNDMYAILDQRRGRVFVYNVDGYMMFMFGGLGTTAGTVETPTSLVYFNGEFLVLDGSKNCIVTYQLTEYGSLFFEAEAYKAANDYENETAIWEQLLEYNQDNLLVLTQLGNAAYRLRDMETALDYYERADDKTNYSKAWEFRRREIIQEHFNLLAAIVIILLLLLIARAIFNHTYRKKHPKPKKTAGPLRYSTYVCGRMLDGYWDLKRENRGSVGAAFILIGLTMLALIIQSQFTGFIFWTTDPDYANIFYDILTVAVPFVLWIIAQWCVTSLMSGEGSFKDIFIATAYALTPIIIATPIATIFSWFLTQDEGVIYNAILIIGYLWVVMMLVCSVIQTHNYSFGQALGVIVITVLAMAIIVFVALLVFALVQQMYAFVADIVTEISNR